MTVKKGGKGYPYIESIGCTKSSRPNSASFAATESNSGSPTMAQATVKGTAKC